MRYLIFFLSFFIIFKSSYGTLEYKINKIPPETRSVTSEGGTLSGTTTVCSGNNDGFMNLTDYTGDIIRWEMSTTGANPWFEVVSQPGVASLNYQNLTETTYFRAVVQNASEPIDYSSIAVITVNSPPISGEIEAPDFSCSGDNAGAKLNNFSGDIDIWQISADNITWGDIAGTGNASSISIVLTGNRYIRAEVSTIGCDAVNTESVLITVNQPTEGGNFDETLAVCEANNSTTLTLNNEVGDIIRWESSPTGETPWNTINHQLDNLTVLNLVNTTYYRAIVNNEACSDDYSDIVSIQVNKNTKGGYLLGEKTVCSMQNTGTLTLHGNTGDVLRWEYLENGQPDWQTVTNNTDELTFNNLTTTTQYRAVVRNGACSQENSASTTITVSPLPTVNFNSNNVCVNNQSSFTNSSSISQGEIVSYTWDFGNGHSSSIENPVFTYTQTGNYNVELTTVSDKGCINSLNKVVEIYPNPYVNFTKDDVCFGNNAGFTNGSNIPPPGSLTYNWNFGDGNTSNSTDAEHSYLQDGTFSVTLTATSDRLCVSSLTKEINIYPLPETDFRFENVCFGNAVNFENQSTISEGNLEYEWRFGDGKDTTVMNPKHNYSLQGDYLARLISTSQHGCSDTQDTMVSVYPQPGADFSFEDDCIYDSINFIDESDIGSETLDYYCDFGDGQTSDAIIRSHKYYNSGTYQVFYRISSDNSCESSIIKTVNVFSAPAANFTANNECNGTKVRFNNVSTISSGSAQYEWDFDNGQTSNINNPEYLFMSDSIYNVRLVAVSNNNCSDTTYSSVEIYPEPEPDFSAASVCDGSTVEFSNYSVISSGHISEYLWDFGDGTNSVQVNANKLYLNSGAYNVSLTAHSNFGCSKTANKTITIEEPPIADFSFENVCLNELVLFKNNSFSQNGILSHSWDFNDKMSSVTENPQHNYQVAGIYKVKLKVATPFGCVDSLIRNVIVYSLPRTDAGEDTTISKGYPVILNGKGGYNFEWITYEGLSNPYISNPEANPEETTQYVLMSTSEYGCVNYDTVVVNVVEDYTLQATNVITPNNDGVNDTWKIKNIESYENNILNVYDRWGNAVYQKNGYKGEWDGRNKNNDILPDGTYYYTIEFNDNNKTYRGCITILRN